MSKKGIIYPIRNIYLGTIESLRDENTDSEIWAFYKKTDKLTNNTTYIPIRDDYEYHYIKELQPIKEYMTSKENSTWLTITKINEIVTKANKKVQLSKQPTYQEQIMTRSKKESYTITEDYQKTEAPKQKVMHFPYDKAA